MPTHVSASFYATRVAETYREKAREAESLAASETIPAMAGLLLANAADYRLWASQADEDAKAFEDERRQAWISNFTS